MNGFDMIEYPACAVCGGTDTRAFTWGDYHLNLAEPLHVARCRRCGMLFMSPRPDRQARLALMEGHLPAVLEPYGRQTANYGSVTRSRKPVFQQRLQKLQFLVSGQPAHQQIRLLDIGASSGLLVHLARDAGWDAYGVEPSLEETRMALASGLVLLRSVAEELPFADNTFDVVHSHHVFEHLAYPQSAVKEVYRVLKPDGLLYIEVPNQLDNIMFRRDMLLRRVTQRERNIRSVHHLWFFSRRTLRQLIQTAGFVNVQLEDTYSWKPRGWRAPFTLVTQIAGRFAFGGYLLRAWGRKP